MATRPSTRWTPPTSTFPILGILGLIFVALKLAEVGKVKDWSWWWVMAPFWGPVALVVALFAIGALALGISYLLNWVADLVGKWQGRKHG